MGKTYIGSVYVNGKKKIIRLTRSEVLRAKKRSKAYVKKQIKK